MLNSYFDVIGKERQIQTYDKLTEQALANKTVIFSTDVVHLIKKSDRVVFMHNGMIAENDTYYNLMTNRQSHLYKYLMTDPAGNTNIFRKVLDLYKIQIKARPGGNSQAQEEPE